MALVARTRQQKLKAIGDVGKKKSLKVAALGRVLSPDEPLRLAFRFAENRTNQELSGYRLAFKSRDKQLEQVTLPTRHKKRASSR
jgi:hypothetical protein